MHKSKQAQSISEINNTQKKVVCFKLLCVHLKFAILYFFLFVFTTYKKNLTLFNKHKTLIKSLSADKL